MATCGAFSHIFDKPTTIGFDSLSSWKQLQSRKSFEESYFTEIFSEINRNANPESSRSSTSSCTDSSASQKESNYFLGNQTKHHHKSDSLSTCTESLGFESSDEIEDSDFEKELERSWKCVKKNEEKENTYKSKRLGRKSVEFPPPITTIGKRWMSFKSYRRDGRFILKEIRVPYQEILHASREDGRLKLKFVQSDDEVYDGDEDAEERSDDCTEHCDCDKKGDGDDDKEIGREG
ncbi:hypothetical protein LguiA_021346 [Lonicera macranthoides]